MFDCLVISGPYICQQSSSVIKAVCVVMCQFFFPSAPIFDLVNSPRCWNTYLLFGTGSDLFLHCKCDGGGWPARLIAPPSKFRAQKSESQFCDASTQLGGWNFCFPRRASRGAHRSACAKRPPGCCVELAKRRLVERRPTPAWLIYWK